MCFAEGLKTKKESRMAALCPAGASLEMPLAERRIVRRWQAESGLMNRKENLVGDC